MLNCTVIFDNRHGGVFYSGERVAGCINLILQKSINVRDLIFKSRGRSYCQWVESYGGGKSRAAIIFTGKTDHYKSSMSLLMHHARDALNDTVLLEAGTHSFPFSVTLPEDLPTSFESATGRVRYTIKVKATKHKKSDEKYKMAFTVVSKCDLNSIPNCNIPLKTEARKVFYSFFVSKGALSMNISLSMSGFLPGQQLLITCSIVNISEVSVKEVIFTFVKKVTYSAVSPWKKCRVERNPIVRYVGKGVNKMENLSYPVSFAVPAVPPSTILENLPVLVEYELKVKAKVSSMHSDVILLIPLHIGNIPFKDTSHFYGFEPTQQFSAHGESSLSDGHEMTDAPPMYFKLPPPTTAGSASTSNGIVSMNTESELVFTPRYPIFNFSNMYTG